MGTLNSPSALFSHIQSAHLCHKQESAEQKELAEILLRRWNNLKTNPGMSLEALKEECGEINLDKVLDPQKTVNKKCIFCVRGASKDGVLPDDM